MPFSYYFSFSHVCTGADVFEFFLLGVKNVLCTELMPAVQRGLTTPSMRICDLCVFLRALQRVRVLSKASLSYEWSIEAELFVAVILCCDYTCTWDTVRRERAAERYRNALVRVVVAAI